MNEHFRDNTLDELYDYPISESSTEIKWGNIIMQGVVIAVIVVIPVITVVVIQSRAQNRKIERLETRIKELSRSDDTHNHA